MRLSDADIAPFEGLIFQTAARYAPYLDYEMDDIRQVLRIKVAQAIVAFDAERVRSVSESARERFVFSCLRNRMKDLFKEQDRLNARRNGTQLHIEDFSPDLFERRYLTTEAEEVFAEVEEEYELPSTLTALERSVVELLVADYTQSEIAGALGITRKRVLAAHRSVQEKLADWKPSDQLGDGLPVALGPGLVLASVQA